MRCIQVLSSLKNNSLLFFLLFAIAIMPNVTLDAQIYLDLAARGDKTLDEIVAETEAYFDRTSREKGHGYKPFQRWLYVAERSLNPDGTINSMEMQRAAFERLMKKETKQKNLSVLFEELGPIATTNTSTWSSAIGRISAMGLDRNDDKHFIIGSPTGGVFKTIDKGATWKPIYDFATSTNIRSLEISHTNPDHYWVGTTQQILRSLDGGRTWNSVSTGPLGQINTITMDPNNDDVLLATDRFNGSVYRSSDGGENFDMVHTIQTDTTFDAMYDIEFNTGNSDIVYASGAGHVIRSVDNGQTWTTISGPWGGGAIMLAVTPHDPDFVYALQEISGGYNATFRSTNGGLNFLVRSDNSSGNNNILTYNQNDQGGQAPRDMDIVVDVDNKNHVYVAGTELWASNDGAANFTKIADWLVDSNLPFIHADVDLMYFTENGLYVGSDGGLYISENEGNSFTDYTPGVGIRQFYRIGASATDIDRVSGGSQDNGTGVVVNGTWRDFMGADGMETFIDWSNPDVIFGNVQRGLLYKSLDGGITANQTTQAPGQGNRVTPTEQDPVDPNTLYTGKARLYKSTNGAASWTDILSFSPGGLCNEIAIAPSDNQTIYASWGTRMYVTQNGGASWTQIFPVNPTTGDPSFVNYIHVHPANPDRVLVAQSGVIQESLDGGNTWVDLTSNLPSITYYCAIYQGDTQNSIYAGGSFGIWHTDNTSGSQWINMNGELPIVQVRELEIRDDRLYVGTYGRGLWKGKILNGHFGMRCDKAIEITKPGKFSTLGASYGAGCNNCSDGATNANWYKFIPPVDGKIKISSCQADVDTRLWVYDGTCGALSQIAASDDDCVSSNITGEQEASYVSELVVSRNEPIYLEWDNAHSNSSFFFQVAYTEIECLPSQNLNGNQTTSIHYLTDGDVSSAQKIQSSGIEVVYDAAGQIDMKVDFEVSTGSLFEAINEGCAEKID